MSTTYILHTNLNNLYNIKLPTKYCEAHSHQIFPTAYLNYVLKMQSKIFYKTAVRKKYTY